MFFGRGCQASALDGEVKQSKAYQDIDSMAQTLGVISALVFVAVVALHYQVSPEMHRFADFQGLVCRSEDFRAYIVDVMSWWDLGGGRTFNFSVPVAADKSLDVRYELEIGISERHQNITNITNATNATGSADHIRCFKDGMVAATLEAVFADFPPHLLNVWYSQNRGFYRYSEQVRLTSSIVAALSFVSLLWSMLLHNSLSLSPAGEDISGESLRRWMRLGRPCLALSYLVLMSGLSIFFISHVSAESVPALLYERWEVDASSLALLIVLPASVVGILVALAAIGYCHCHFKGNPQLPLDMAKDSRHLDCAGSRDMFRHDI